MDWLFDNLGKFAPIVIFLIYMINSMRSKGQQEEEEHDPQAAERARKIQEEIRRKILERQRGSEGPTARPPEPTLVLDEEPEMVFEPPMRPTAHQPVEVERAHPAQQTSVEDPFYKKRLQIEAQLKEAEELQAKANRKASELKAGFQTKKRRQSEDGGDIRSALLKGLSEPSNLKTSVLLREILDTPVGMR